MQANDVLVVTEKGNAELRGGGTSLPALHLQALIRVDGKSMLAQLEESAQGVDGALVREALARLLEQRYVAWTGRWCASASRGCSSSATSRWRRSRRPISSIRTPP
jgi:hypothetical protein